MRSLGSSAIVAGVVLGVAAAVAVPVLLAIGDDDSRPAAPAGALALGDLPTGAAPKSGYLAGTEFRRGSEQVTLALDTGADVAELVTLTDGYLLSTTPDGDGATQVHVLAADGTGTAQWSIPADSMLGTLAGSADGRLGAFVKSIHAVVVVQDAGHTLTDLEAPRDDFGLPVAPVAVTGTDCAGPDADCTVVVNRMESYDGGSAGGSTWMARPGKRPVKMDGGITNVSAIAADGSTAGTVRIVEDGDGSCAGVAGPRGTVRWTSCRDRILSFSPDSASVLAGTSASFGSGDHELTVLDASTGDERLRLGTASNVGIFETVWEDDDHLLAVVSDWREDEDGGDHRDRRWAVLRIGLDGTREYAVEPVPGDPDDYDGPLDLPQH